MTLPDLTLPLDLGGGLTLRRGAAADAARLNRFCAMVHSEEGPDKPDERLGAWAGDLAGRPHPTFSPADFTIVEDRSSGEIVSSLCAIPQTWSYAGIPFKISRPELVGTHPEYRRRGLVRKQFEVVHAWARQRGQLVQAITGIPYYYRQFGYEPAANLGGGRTGYRPQLPALKDGQQEPFRLRPAAAEDLPLIAELDRRGRERSLLRCVWTEDLWRYELQGKSEKSIDRLEIKVIESASGRAVGFLTHPPFLWGPRQVATCVELSADTSWLAAAPSILRGLWQVGEARAARDQGALQALGFVLGERHPLYEAAGDRLPQVRKPYAWHLRVADLPGFLTHISAALEARLAASVCSGYTGELKIDFYRSGLCLRFDGGRLASAEPWRARPIIDPGHAGFPDLTFLQLLFGYRSLSELRHAFVDVWASDDLGRPLLEALFPRQASELMPVA